MNKVKLYAVAVGSAIASFGLSLVSAHAEVMSSSTLGDKIDGVNANVMDSFGVLLTHYWGFIVGFIILLGVWRYGKRIAAAFTS